MLGYGVIGTIKNYQLRIKNWVVFFWLLFIPTQLGMHFWPEWSHVMGLRVDYLSPTLYFLDLIWIGMVVFNLPKSLFDKRDLMKYLLLFVFILINIFVAQNQWVAIVRWLRIFQWIITLNLIISNKKLFKEMLVKVLPFWIIGESLLGLAQVVNGGSLNGIFYWLGERRFSYVSLGVAQISYLGQGLIRAYGTFSHPNSLAGFLLISLILFINFQKTNLQFPNKFQISNIKLQNIFYWMVVFCGLLGIFLSGSRTVWGILIVLVISYQLRVMSWKNMLGKLLIIGGILILVLGLINNNYRMSDFVGGWDGDGMVKRGALMVASLKMIKDNPLFGVGANNFLVNLPEYQKNSGVFWLQPVHNILFLIVSEYGFVGLFIIFLISKKQIYNFSLKGLPSVATNNKYQFTKNKLILLGIILVTGMMDHYWLTLPQNWWLMCVISALAL